MPTRPAYRVLAAALALGLIADQLLRAPVWGLNVSLGFLALAVCALLPVWRERPDGIPERISDPPWAWLAALFFAGMWTIRDAEALLAVDLLAALALLGLPVLDARGQALRATGVVETALAPVRAGFQSAFGALSLVTAVRGDWPGGPGLALRGRGLAIGLLLALPPILVFTGLFASADPIFENVVSTVLDMGFQPVVSHAVTITAVTWGTAGYLWALARPGSEGDLPTPRLSLGATPVLVPLAATTLLFTVFVATQAGSLFGGEAYVEGKTGLTYAEYARGGFFQLVFASLLVLPMVYAVPFVAGAIPGGEGRSVRAVLTVLLALTGLVLASALWRMSLYVDAYGLTEDRLYGLAMMLWIGAMLVIFAVTVVRGQYQGVALRSVIAAVAALAALNLANPKAVIARYNVSHRGPQADFEHLARLGGDAVPVLVAAMDNLPAHVRCPLIGKLREDHQVPRGDWRGWNLARVRAAESVKGIQPCRPLTPDP